MPPLVRVSTGETPAWAPGVSEPMLGTWRFPPTSVTAIPKASLPGTELFATVNRLVNAPPTRPTTESAVGVVPGSALAAITVSTRSSVTGLRVPM